MRRASALLAVIAVVTCLCGCGESFWRELAKNSANPTGDLSRIGYAYGEQPPQVAPQVVPQKSLAPAPKLTKGKPRKVNGKNMATYIASSAGIAAVNANPFTPVTGGWDNGTWRLYYHADALTWCIGTVMGEDPALGHVAYAAWGSAGTVPLVGWSAHGAYSPDPAPAPTLTEAGSPVAGDSNPYGWGHANFFWPGDAPVTPNRIAPCAATIGGTHYIVFGVNGATDHGFMLADPLTGQFTYGLTAGTLFSVTDDHSAAALYPATATDCVWACDGAPSANEFIWKQFDLSSFSQVSTVTVPLNTRNITNFVPAGGDLFYLCERDGETLRLLSYYGGDVAVTEVRSWAQYEWPGLPLGRFEFLSDTSPTHADHSLVRTTHGDLWYMRRTYLSAPGGVMPAAPAVGIVAHNLPLVGDQVKQVPPAELSASAGPYASWGEYNYEQTRLLGMVGNGSDAADVTFALDIGVSITDLGSFTGVETGPRWFVNDGSLLYVAGWGRDDYYGCPFVLLCPQMGATAGIAEATASGLQATAAVSSLSATATLASAAADGLQATATVEAAKYAASGCASATAEGLPATAYLQQGFVRSASVIDWKMIRYKRGVA